VSNLRTLRAVSPEPPTDAEFEEFWSAYPRHEAMKEARSAYMRARNLVTHETLVVGARQHAAQYEPEYATLAHKWLRGERWNDEPVKRNGHSTELPARSGLSADEQQWRCRLVGYAKSKFWSGMWGEPPDSGRCYAPESLLKEFGFG
jgi:hypothetical protein